MKLFQLELTSAWGELLSALISTKSLKTAGNKQLFFVQRQNTGRNAGLENCIVLLEFVS